MYYPDLSIHEGSFDLEHNYTILNVGWLESSYPFQQGSTSEEFISHLLIFCMNPVLLALGRHECDLSTKNEAPLSHKWIEIEDQGKNAVLGSGIIWVVNRKGILYSAPDLIYHYVTCHHYQPPKE